MIKEELNKVQDDEDGEECVEVDVEGEAPLHVVIALVARLDQVLVRDRPEQSGHHQTHADTVHEYHIKEEFDEVLEAVQSEIKKISNKVAELIEEERASFLAGTTA